MKKQVFRAVGSICAAGIMGFSAVCMSSCSNKIADKIFAMPLAVFVVGGLYAHQGWNLLVDALSSEESKKEKTLDGLYVTSETDSLWTVVNRDNNSTTLSDYENEIDLLEQKRLLAVIRFSQPIDDCLETSKYWLPLPMEEKVKLHLDNKKMMIPLDEENGYWFFYEKTISSLSEINWEEYDISVDHYNIAWYDSSKQTLQVYRYHY